MSARWDQQWDESEWPTTILRDRYGGVYSGGAWTAWPLEPDAVPAEASGDDVRCRRWWKERRKVAEIPVGVGDSPQAALEALRAQIDHGGRKVPPGD